MDGWMDGQLPSHLLCWLGFSVVPICKKKKIIIITTFPMTPDWRKQKKLTLTREWTEVVCCFSGRTGSVGVRSETMCEPMCVGADICEHE